MINRRLCFSRERRLQSIAGLFIGTIAILSGCSPWPGAGALIFPEEPSTNSVTPEKNPADLSADDVRITPTPMPTAEEPSQEMANVAEHLAAPVTVTQPLTRAAPTVADLMDAEAADTAVEADPTPAADETNSADAVEAAGAPRGVVSGSVVNLRSGPGTQYATLGQTVAGDTVEIVGRNGDASWWLVCCPAPDGGESWIFAELVTPRTPTDATPAELADRVPVAAIPPTPVPEPTVAPAAQPAVQNRTAEMAAAPASGLPGPGGFGAPGATNPLTGLPLPDGRAGQRPLIVCINNDFAARPQFGTANADIMYEYLMEGYGITRFSGVYYGEESGQIGPMRSARLINYYMGSLYDAGLACSGASDQVRYMLKHQAPFPYLDIDLDDPSNTRYSTNVGTDYRTRLRTSTGQLRTWLADWGVEKPASIRGFTFGERPGGGATATSITVPYPSSSRSVYRYDPASGRYLRAMGGGAHVDGNTGAQIAVDNVVVQYVPHETTDIVEDSLGSLSIRLNLFGSGRALVFRDGQAFEGTWRSESQGDMPRFFTADGAEIALKPGKTWISIVPLSYSIAYQ